MKPKTPQQKATETYTANKLDKGWVRIHPWVPAHAAEAEKERIRKKYKGEK